jgi:hypothetical protein
MVTVDIRLPWLTPDKIVRQDPNGTYITIRFESFVKLVMTYEQAKAVWAILDPTFNLPDEE